MLGVQNNRWLSQLWVEKQLNQPLLYVLQLETVRGSVQVFRVDLQLSNLDFWVWLLKRGEDNNLWLSNKRDPVCTDILARAEFIFWCVLLSLLACWQELVFVVWFCELTRWVQDALSESTPMQNIHFMMCEVCYLNGESGLLSRMSVSSQLSAVSFVAMCNPLMEPDLKSVRSRLQLEHFHLF